MQLDEPTPKVTDVTSDERFPRRRLKIAFLMLLLAMAMSWLMPLMKQEPVLPAAETQPESSDALQAPVVEDVTPPEAESAEASAAPVAEEAPVVQETAAEPVVEKPAEKPVAEDGRVVALQARIDALQQRLDALESAPKVPDATMELATMKERMALLQQQAQGSAMSGQKMMAMWLGLQSLVEGVRSGRPYVQEWKRMQTLADEAAQPALSSLSAWQADGVVSLAQLSAQFEDEIAAGVPVSEDLSVLGQVQQKLRSLVRVRRVDAKAKGDDALLAQAEAALARGDVAMALERVRALPLGWRAVTSAWIRQAEVYVRADDAIVALQQWMVDRSSSATEQVP